MTSTVVRAIKTANEEVIRGPLESWGRRPEATGDAQTSGRTFLPHEDLPVVGSTGIWESTAGRWTVAARPITEVAFIVAGRGRVTDADGGGHDLAAGDVLVLPAGWTGEWEIHEDLRKVYALIPSGE